MKKQWNLILSLIFALIVAVFAVINVNPVNVNYVFGASQLPLILVILGSTLMGGIIVGSVGLFRMYLTNRKLKQLTKEHEAVKAELEKVRTDLQECEEKEKSGMVQHELEMEETFMEDSSK
ncbi:DUF1049 domain-containing protein [Bacillus sp. HMF5848]|uniref:LapA family protein n=1 Tax=Bacillus sp. HMF5848 TaxID=2495421 RepID=UPI000F77B124|nr:lipopolysaccharide assembly protein LapA domain-containing protein [Bacillus sp. HMF5848]RSK27988.1 DUF1049 domain-containing protein [Bacillus sp. HMF5848]